MTGRAVEDALAGLAATPAQRAQVRALAERLYGHVLRTIDRDALYIVDQLLWSELARLGVPDDEGELALALVADALFRAGLDPGRTLDPVPPGITALERIAAEWDADCLLCQHDLDEARRLARGGDADGDEDDDDDWAELVAGAATMWRAQHADALRRFGLA